MKPYFLQVHRWIALLFALPVLVSVVTGLVPSFEPSIVTRAIEPGQLTASHVERLLGVQASSGQAFAIGYRSYDGMLTIVAGALSALMNIVVSVVTLALLVTSLMIWLRQSRWRLALSRVAETAVA